MKNKIKHIIALFLTLAMLFQITVFVAATETAEPVGEDTYVIQNLRLFKILNSLGVFEIFDEDKYTGNAEISRAEAAAIAARMSGLAGGNSMEGEEMPFVDVSDTHTFAYEICHMNKLGIMTGYDGKFSPDESITEEQFIKVVVETLGYGVMAQYEGGYPNGYVKTAHKYHIIDNVDYKGTVPITEDVAVQIVYNAITVEMPNSFYLENGTLVTGVGGTIMEKNLNVIKTHGIMMRNKGTHIVEKDGTKEGIVQIGKDYYYTGKSSCEDYLGYNVEIFYKESEDDLGTILYAEPRNNDVLVIDAKDIENYADNEYIYYRDNKKKTADFPTNAYVIYNGTSVDSGFNNHIPEIGSVTLIDNDKNGVVDVVSIISYGIYYIDANNAYEGVLTSKDNKTVTYVHSNWNVTGIDGKALAGESVKGNDVLLLAINESGDLIKGFAVGEIVEGTVDAYSTQGTTKYVEINGEKYRASSYCTDDFGTKIKIGVEAGFVVYDGVLLAQVKPTSALTESIGYLIGIDHTTGLTGKTMLRMLLQSGEIKDIRVAKNARLVCYGKSEGKAEDFPTELPQTFNFYENLGVGSTTITGSEISVRQPVIYKLNATGEVVYLEIAPDHNYRTSSSVGTEEGFHLICDADALVAPYFRYRSNSRYIHNSSSILDENGFVIVVPASEDADNLDAYSIYTATEYGKLFSSSDLDFDTSTEAVRLYRTDNDIIGANIMVGGLSLVEGATEGVREANFLIDQISQSVTDDGEYCYKLKSHDGNTYMTEDTSVFTGVANLTEGDYVTCKMNSYGLVDEIILIYDWETSASSATLGVNSEKRSYDGGQVFMKRGNVIAYYAGTIPDGITEGTVDISKLRYLDVSKIKILVYDSSRNRAESHIANGSSGNLVPYLVSSENATKIFVRFGYGNPNTIILYK